MMHKIPWLSCSLLVLTACGGQKATDTPRSPDIAADAAYRKVGSATEEYLALENARMVGGLPSHVMGIPDMLSYVRGKVVFVDAGRRVLDPDFYTGNVQSDGLVARLPEQVGTVVLFDGPHSQVSKTQNCVRTDVSPAIGHPATFSYYRVRVIDKAAATVVAHDRVGADRCDSFPVTKQVIYDYVKKLRPWTGQAPGGEPR